MKRRALFGGSVAAFVAVTTAAALAQADDHEPKAATFALIIGSNQSVDSDVRPLQYADDDAAGYFDLFRVLGARTYLLSRLDENTRRLHAQAAAEASEPRRAAFEQAVAQITADVARAGERRVDTVLYVVYAGHGNVRDGEGYVALEDMRLTGTDLARVVRSIPATRVHLIVDACASYYLAYSRGPGGERRPLRGFQDAGLTSDPRVGLLLSTSSARESHEWDGFQAGVFSHEVRSGLYGAADADGDGRVSYREIAAFISRANAAIPNERFRPQILTHAPQASETLVDLQRGLERRLDIDGAHAGHYWLEDARGLRLLDAHNGDGQPVHLVRPSLDGPIYVHRTEDDTEVVLPPFPDVVSLGDLERRPTRVASRGAAHEAFNLLFALPFDSRVVATYVEPAPTFDPLLPPTGPTDARLLAPASARAGRVVGWSAVGLGIAGVALGTGVLVAAHGVAAGASPSDSQSDIADRNTRISAFDVGATVSLTAGALSAAAGLVLLLWPDAPRVQASALQGGGYARYGVAF
ncbi:MAG: caspase family protein [Polyangiaceae bacterium]